MQDLENILTKFGEFVSPNFCNDLAKNVALFNAQQVNCRDMNLPRL